MPVAANPVLWSNVPEIPNVDGDEYMTLLKKVSTSPDVTEWRRYKIGDYFQEIETRFNQLQALLAPPESGEKTLVCVTPGMSVAPNSSNKLEWHRVMNRVFVRAEVGFTNPPANTAVIRITGLPYPPAMVAQCIGVLGNTGAQTNVNIYPPNSTYPDGAIVLFKFDVENFTSPQVATINFSGSYEI